VLYSLNKDHDCCYINNRIIQRAQMEIKNKVAIVTGGASGLGEATARLYTELGASVAP